MILSTQDVMSIGLNAVGVSFAKQENMSDYAMTVSFRKHYGSSPLDVANIWYDLTVTDIPGAALSAEENTERGFVMFMMAHHFLWTYPRNAVLFASRFGTNEKYASGKHLWKWVAKIAALKSKKIVWDDSLNHPDTKIYVVSVDGVDFKCFEPQHPNLPVDPQMMSKKFNKSGYKYEIAISVYSPQVVWLSGPHKGGKHDMTIFCEGLKQKMNQLPGKMVNADLGYRS